MSLPEPDSRKTEEVPEPTTPCVGVCRLDSAGAYCTACLRSLDEIAGWSRFTRSEKRAVLATLAKRRALLR